MDRGGAGGEKRLAPRKEQHVFDLAASIDILDLPTEMLLMILEELLKIDPVTLLGSVPGVSSKVRALALGVRGKWPEKPLTKQLERKTFDQVTGALRSAVNLFPRTTGLSVFGYPLHRMSAAGIVVKVGRGISELLKNINEFNTDGHTPLIIACWNGYLNVVWFLLENGADVNKADGDGETPLYVACWNGRLDVVRMLVENGADVNKAKEGGFTPLRRACWSGDLEVVRFLVQNGAKFHNSDIEIVIACQKGHLGVVRFLLENGVGVNKADEDGWTPLLEACEYGQLDIVRLLVEAGANVNQADAEGFTPLGIAYEYGRTAVAQLLEDNGAV